ncbi:hypothetical protein [Gimesia algae]|uniref:Uncharacterized protein n=1 Tax=Gimesia algae TaxID=2527971 RepID=A0A517VGM7_9PLAN|nr:hypothetical protein [Gimesia algae]QDT92162.1 hypothetical protein Pan161_38290 [Gimesia algae]
MHHTSLIFLMIILCLGCIDPAVKQQKAEQARRAKTVEELKELGQQMHKTKNIDSATDPIVVEPQQDEADSSKNISGRIEKERDQTT